MLYKDYDSPSSPLFSQLGLLKLKEVYILQIGKLMYNQMKRNNLSYSTITSLFTAHTHNTRSARNLNCFVPSVYTNLGKTSFNYQGPKIWNSLPIELKKLSQFQFKSSLKKHLINTYLPHSSSKALSSI